MEYNWIAGDFGRVSVAPPTLRGLAHEYVLNPGFRAVVLYRIAHILSLRGWHRIAAWMTSHSVSSTGCEILCRAEIGPGLLLHHPVGIVIGWAVRAGRNCTILQGVTIGEKYSPPDDHAYPVIGDNVTICAGAVLVGGIVVGNDAIIGANSVVLADVPAGTTAVGLPARILHRAVCANDCT